MREIKPYNQERLLEAFRAGDDAAFTQLFRELYPAMTLYGLKYTKQYAVAEEIAEAAFVKAWEHRETFSQFKVLCSWLYKTVRFACIDWLRHQKVKKEFLEVVERYETYPTALDHLVKAELLRHLSDALDRLPGQQQKIVKAFYLEEKSLKEIAEQLNISINTVKSQKNGGLINLRKLIPLILYFLDFFTKMI